MSKRTHDKQLARARAKRRADRLARRKRRQRLVATVVVLGMALAALGVAIAFRDPGQGDAAAGDAQATDVDGGDDAAQAAPAVEPCPPPGDAVPAVDATMYDARPEADLGNASQLTAMIDTSCGAITLALDAEAAPRTVSTFVALARDDYYQGVGFHRVIDGFMIQGGDPAGTGCGQSDCTPEGFDPDAPSYPGYEFEDELGRAEELVAETGGYPRGTLAMANAGPDTNGSQFFIVQRDRDLPPDYTVFGEVTDGMDVVDRIAAGPTTDGSAPEQPTVMLDVEIEEP